jgi:microcystin-dependent protein
MKNVLRLIVMVVAVFTATMSLTAQNDIKLSVQGTLKDANGSAVEDGPQDLTFRLYDVSSGGTALWTEDASVHVIGGVYSHNLGSVEPLDPGHFSQTLYVGVTVNGIELSPRTELTYSPYTLYVGFAGNGTPVGGIVPYAGFVNSGNIPPGWLVCDGRAVSSTQYPALYAALNTAWGDGSTGAESGPDKNFNLPDLRGMFLRGLDAGRGMDPDASGRTAAATGGNTGDMVGTVQGEGFKSHDHHVNLTTSTDGNHDHKMTGDGANGIGGGSSGGDLVIHNDDGVENHGHRWTGYAGSHNHTVVGDTDLKGGNETRPKNAAVVYLIKY